MNKILQILNLYQLNLSPEAFNRSEKLAFRDCSLLFTSHLSEDDENHDDDTPIERNHYEMEFIDHSIENLSVFKLVINDNGDFVSGEYSGENMEKDEFIFEIDEYLDLIIHEFDGL
jgi:hypothetical protein